MFEVSGGCDDQSVGGEAAMGEGEKLEARGDVTDQPSKASICPVLKVKLVAELQMMLPFGRRTPNDIGSPSFSSPIPYDPIRFPAEKDCESTIPTSLLFIVSFKTSLSELLCK